MVDLEVAISPYWTNVPFRRVHVKEFIESMVFKSTRAIPYGKQKEPIITTAEINKEELEGKPDKKEFIEPTISNVTPDTLIELEKSIIEFQESLYSFRLTLTPVRILLFLITSSCFLGIGLAIFVLSICAFFHPLTGFIALLSSLGLFVTSILSYKEWKINLI